MQLVMAQQDDAVSPKDWLNSVLEEAAPKASAVWDDWGATALVIVAALVVAIGVMRVVAGRRARRRRRTVLLKPSNKFDPSPEEVLRFCGQLARVHSATTRVTEPASTRTIRVTLTGAGEGRMAQLLSGPAAAEQILRHRGFAQVELADPAAMLSSGASGPGSGHVHIGVGDYDHTVENHNNLLGLFRENEDTLYRLAQNPDRPAHRGTRWCQPNSVPSTGYRDVTDVRRGHNSHSLGLNFESVQGQRTDHVEFRMWDGTLDPGVIQTQVKTSRGLTEAAFRTPGENHPRR